MRQRTTLERGADGKFRKVKNSPHGDTAAQIASELGVNRDTIKNAARFVEGLDAADEAVPGFKDDVLTGAVKAQKQEIAAMRKQTPEEIKQSVKDIHDRKSAKRKPSNKAIARERHRPFFHFAEHQRGNPPPGGDLQYPHGVRCCHSRSDAQNGASFLCAKGRKKRGF